MIIHLHKSILTGYIEVPVLFMFLGYMLAGAVITNFIIYRTCYAVMDFNKSECALLGVNYTDNATAELEGKVQPYASDVMMAVQVMEAVIPPFICFFFGAWSDKYGRRPLLLLTTGASVLTYLVLVAVAAIPNASPWFVLLCSIPNYLTGGGSTFITAATCYTAEATSNESRGFRMGVVQVMHTLGNVLGSSTSSFIFNAFGYPATFAVCSGCAGLACLYTYFAIPETVPNIKKEGKLRDLFKFSLLVVSIKALFEKRKSYNRAVLLTVASVMVLHMFGRSGDAAVLFLYLRNGFQWTLQKYTLYVSIVSVIEITGVMAGIYILHKVLHVGEASVIIVGALSALTGGLFLGLSTENWQIYVVGVVKCLRDVTIPMARSLLSKIVGVEDTGKVFSVTTAFDMAGALLGSSAYLFIYRSTLGLLPAAFSFVTVGIFVFIILLVGATLIMQRAMLSKHQKSSISHAAKE